MAEPAYPSRESRLIVSGPDELNRAAAGEFVRSAQNAIGDHGRFVVALSGGNTPRSVYGMIASEHRDRLPWDEVFIFFGDERHVPPDHPDSNYRMAEEALLSRVPIPTGNIYRIRAELPAQDAAARYEQALREFFHLADGEWPRFDLILLGMGDDGHTASLFPGTAGLKEDRRLVIANHVEKLQTERITFTFPVLNNAAEVLFLISGASKAEVIGTVLGASPPENKFPIQQVSPRAGRVLWILDKAAGRLI
jgi:6-phosphogluconolactonase